MRGLATYRCPVCGEMLKNEIIDDGTNIVRLCSSRHRMRLVALDAEALVSLPKPVA